MNQATILPLDPEEGETNSMTLTDIYGQLLASGGMILTIPAAEEDRLRKGLASVKAKTNKKLSDDGFPVDKSTLAYQVTTSRNEDGSVRQGVIDINISLSTRNQITILDMKLPDDQF